MNNWSFARTIYFIVALVVITEGTFYVKDKERQFTYFGAVMYSTSIQTEREICLRVRGIENYVHL